MITTVLTGECTTVMQGMNAGSVQTCVTSPPYFGLRDYEHPDQIGRETTPREYIERLVEVFREVRRLLRQDGTLWLNLGDTIVKKQLQGMPWRVALALQADGWYLRQDIIWAKPNPIPESVQDRCTKAHEYIFLLSKNPQYYFDYKAIREKGVIPAGTKGAKGSAERAAQPGVNARPPEYKIYDGMRNLRSVWNVQTRPSYKGAHFATFPPELIKPCILAGAPEGAMVLDPFAGSGTTGVVSKELGRDSTLIEINENYTRMILERLGEQ